MDGGAGREMASTTPYARTRLFGGRAVCRPVMKGRMFLHRRKRHAKTSWQKTRRVSLKRSAHRLMQKLAPRAFAAPREPRPSRVATEAADRRVRRVHT